MGIQLPSISLWPWADTRQHRAATFTKQKHLQKHLQKQPQPHLLQKQPPPPPPPQVSVRRQDAPGPRPQQTHKPRAQFTFKKPTGLEKKPFGPKYPAKFQKYSKSKSTPGKKVRLAPIPDLRPTSIDRIDILR